MLRPLDYITYQGSKTIRYGRFSLILSWSTKLVQTAPEDLVVKTKLSPRNASASFNQADNIH